MRGIKLNMYFVYLLENQGDKSWYIGFTTNISLRISRHLSGQGGRTTGLKRSWKLVYFEAYLDKSDALGREKFLKSGSGRCFLKRQLANYLNH